MRAIAMVSAFGLGVGLLTGCGGAAECGEAECKAICDAGAPAPAPKAPAGVSMTAFEKSLLDPLVSDVKQGVRPFGENAIGICKGKKECDEFLGADAGELPPGDYMVKAELQVPDIGELGTWTVLFKTECATIRDRDGTEDRTSRDYKREYKVRYAGKERGYRLQPLRTIDSPARTGRTECTYEIVAPHPDGDKVFKGSWSTPDPDAAKDAPAE